MAFFIVRIFLQVITFPLNEVFPKLNLPFLKGYSPNKMNRKMPPVHINVILPSSKSALITTFKEAAQLTTAETQLLSIQQENCQRGSQTVSSRGALLWRCKAHVVPQMICPCPFPGRAPPPSVEEGRRSDVIWGLTEPALFSFCHRFLTTRWLDSSFPSLYRNRNGAPEGDSLSSRSSGRKWKRWDLRPILYNREGFALAKRRSLCFHLSSISPFKRNSLGGWVNHVTLNGRERGKTLLSREKRVLWWSS